MNATLTNLTAALAQHPRIIVRHPISGAITIRAAKALGFGSGKVMVQFHDSNDWTVIDPLTWTILL